MYTLTLYKFLEATLLSLQRISPEGLPLLSARNDQGKLPKQTCVCLMMVHLTDSGRGGVHEQQRGLVLIKPMPTQTLPVVAACHGDAWR